MTKTEANRLRIARAKLVGAIQHVFDRVPLPDERRALEKALDILAERAADIRYELEEAGETLVR